MKTAQSLIAALMAATALTAQAADITVHADRHGAPIQPTMYGLFFEDINYAADGGLYAEMVKNRSFEFPDHLMGWKAFGQFDLKDDGPFERNPHYITLRPTGHRNKYSGLENEGFFGIAVRKGEDYRFSVWARVPAGSEGARVRVELVDPASGEESVVLAARDIDVNTPEWTKYTCTLSPNRTVRDGRLRVFLWHPEKSAVDLEHISLFPVNTWRRQENGLRADLAQALYDIRPGVFRFPGGCIVEGTDIPDRYQWKNTVGPVENRPLNLNRWQFEFPHRFYPDYYQSYGLGFYEYFRLAEDMGAEPLPVLNVGMVCQYENPDPKAHVPVDSLDCYIQDALDLIEFANGPVDSTWGKVRADMGHPEPFNLKFLAIGNEQWGPEYVERLEPFVKVLREKAPEIKIVGSSGPSPSGEQFDYLWPEMKRLGADLVDEHYYANEEWFRNNANRYDSYDRNGPKVFAGEYACHGANGHKYNHYWTSLLEAAFMTGLERNADIVHMATYAPLFAHEKGWQWRPDMIWFDNDSHRLTSSYEVQRLYSTNKGTEVAPVTVNGPETFYASGAYDADKGQYIVKAVNISGEPEQLDINLSGLPRKKAPVALDITMMTGADGDSDYHELQEYTLPADMRSITLPARSFAVIRYTVK